MGPGAHPGRQAPLDAESEPTLRTRPPQSGRTRVLRGGEGQVGLPGKLFFEQQRGRPWAAATHIPELHKPSSAQHKGPSQKKKYSWAGASTAGGVCLDQRYRLWLTGSLWAHRPLLCRQTAKGPETAWGMEGTLPRGAHPQCGSRKGWRPVSRAEGLGDISDGGGSSMCRVAGSVRVCVGTVCRHSVCECGHSVCQCAGTVRVCAGPACAIVCKCVRAQAGPAGLGSM